MGLIHSKNDSRFFLIVGLDASGKKKILYRLKYDRDEPTIPSKGFFIEEIIRTHNYNGGQNEITTKINLLVISGQYMIRPFWSTIYKNSSQDINEQALIFVIDSSDIERLMESKRELHILNENKDTFKDHPFLIYANKQDLPQSLSILELIDQLELNKLTKYRKWHIQSSVAITGDGVENGIKWLLSHKNHHHLKA